MKRIAFFGLVILSALLCTSASVWEGAASVSLNGELPEEGYYVATRSFPRNTVVDVTNLENSQTIRVIVASGLDSPGLLAILSREAAGAIGLHARSIGRIRMSMPSDPVGFSRFTDELDSSGDPDFDPAAAIAAAKDSGFNVKQAEAAIEKDPVKAGSGPESGGNDTVAQKPAIAPNPAASDIVDLPESYMPSPAKDDAVKNEPVPVVPAWAATVPGTYGYTPEPVIPPDTSNVAQAYPPEQIPEKLEPEVAPVAPAPPPVAPAPRTVTPAAPPPVAPAPQAQLALVPAEQRPPESAYQGLPPEAEIAPLKERAPSSSQPGIIPEEYIIPPIGNRPAPAAAVQTDPVLEPEIPSIERERTVRPSPEIITEVTVVEANPAPANMPPQAEPPALVPAAVDGDVNFSVPRISSLEKGKYYLQLAAYTVPELVETELRKISTIYPLAVQEGGNSAKPLYRILVGPVNLGESGALLQRFKVSGYRDAFIRKEG